MITTVMFDMGGTLEDIWVDAQSEREAIEKLDVMLKSYGLDPKADCRKCFEKNINWIITDERMKQDGR